MNIKVLTWNLRRANQNSEAWNIIVNLNADILLLQEVASIPLWIQQSHSIHCKPARSKTGLNQKFSTVILGRGIELIKTQLTSSIEWVTSELQYFEGNILSCEAIITGYQPLNLVSVYSPAWSIERERLKDIDITSIKLTQNKDIFCTELLWSALSSNKNSLTENWIVAGDFNSSVTFDYLWGKKPRGNQEIIDRMNSIGFKECLYHSSGKLVPTFKNAKGNKIIHQMDHMYVSSNLINSLERCSIGDSFGIFENSISDHLPIISDFNLTVE